MRDMFDLRDKSNVHLRKGYLMFKSFVWGTATTFVLSAATVHAGEIQLPGGRGG